MKTHYSRIVLTCDECGRPFTAVVSPGFSGFRWGLPVAPEVDDLEDGCQHVLTAWEDGEKAWDRLYNQIIDALADAEQAAYDREMDARYEREKDARYERER